MNLTCDHATALVPSYLDGELTEAQAAPLRAHLFDCVGCREVAKDAKVLKRWLVAGDPAVVPAGFAARVARRAFAGDAGESATASGAAAAREPEAALLPFVLRLTVAAAAVLLCLAAAMQLQSRPTESDELRADDLDSVWEEIYGMDAPRAAGHLPAPAPEEPRAAPATTSATPAQR